MYYRVYRVALRAFDPTKQSKTGKVVEPTRASAGRRASAHGGSVRTLLHTFRGLCSTRPAVDPSRMGVQHDRRRAVLKAASWFGAQGGFACVMQLNIYTADDYLRFLQEHNFNAVRLPVSAHHVLNNPTPGAGELPRVWQLHLHECARRLDTPARHDWRLCDARHAHREQSGGQRRPLVLGTWPGRLRARHGHGRQ